MCMKALITLLTDFGLEDEYIGVMKGVIKTINPNVEFIDISNEIPAWDIRRAAFYIGYSYKFFPRNTIHIIVVDPGVGTKRDIICVRASAQTFLAPDNGVLSVVLNKEKNAKIYKVSNKRYMLNWISSTFHGRDIFAPVAAHLSRGVLLDNIGKRANTFKKLDRIEPLLTKDRLTGEVIYSDRFGNLITNINFGTFNRFINPLRKPSSLTPLEDSLLSLADFSKWVKPNKSLKIKVGNIKINKIKSSYEESNNRYPFVIFGSKGLLEISVKKGSARNFFRGNKGLKVEISL
ncbi:MAG: SAM-dependent chlorinase/fluorinase [Candidatus Omnitrophica bacterium]|nr:SAM-dependent chlorinase/fluorinase [Candidatus Omnitrophota bacterium]